MKKFDAKLIAMRRFAGLTKRAEGILYAYDRGDISRDQRDAEIASLAPILDATRRRAGIENPPELTTPPGVAADALFGGRTGIESMPAELPVAKNAYDQSVIDAIKAGHPWRTTTYEHDGSFNVELISTDPRTGAVGAVEPPELPAAGVESETVDEDDDGDPWVYAEPEMLLPDEVLAELRDAKIDDEDDLARDLRIETAIAFEAKRAHRELLEAETRRAADQ